MQYLELDSPLYHGSDIAVSTIDLSISVPNKDFGKGFYCTTDFTQAEKFARLKAKRKNTSKGFVSTFTFIKSSDLEIKKFAKSDNEWFDFVLSNRGHINLVDTLQSSNYDIVIGPVADDAVGLVLNQYISGTFGVPTEPEAKATAIRLLLTQKLHNQVFFGTECAIGYLKYMGTQDVSSN
jgi:hypothetical protein